MHFPGPYDLEFILPELLLPSLVEEREVAHMVDEDISQYGQI